VEKQVEKRVKLWEMDYFMSRGNKFRKIFPVLYLNFDINVGRTTLGRNFGINIGKDVLVRNFTRD
jgi:hypothetical protein